MKKFLVLNTLIFVAFVAIACTCAYISYKYASRENADTTRQTVYDTIPYYKPVPKDSLITRYRVVKLPVYDTISVGEYIQETFENISDSADVVIPITQKHYADSTFDAWVSGFQVTLDSLKVYQKTEIVTIREKQKRWSVGIHGGYGFTPKGLQPYVGVGVSYRIFP